MHQVNAIVELGIGSTVNTTRRQLSSLSNEQLRDLGFERGQIDDVARGLAGRMAAPMRRLFTGQGMSLSPLFRAYVSG